MSWLATAAPPPKGDRLPATLEGNGTFCVKTAGISRPAAPMKGDPSMVLVTAADGGVVVYPPSEKLVILEARRAAKIATVKAPEPPPAA